MEPGRATIERVTVEWDEVMQHGTVIFGWAGPADGTAELGYSLLPRPIRDYKAGDLIHLNGVTVQVVGRTDSYRMSYLVRLPARTWRFYAALTAARRRVRWVDVRLRMTCEIWGLIPYQMGVEPRWRDLILWAWAVRLRDRLNTRGTHG